MVGGPPSAKMARLSGPPANAMPVPLSNLTGVTTAGGAAGPTATSSIGGPSAAGSAAKLPIQLPTQPVPMVNGVVKGTEHSQIITASSMAGGSMATLGGGGVLTQTQAGTSSQQLSATGQLGGGQPVNPGGGQPQVTSQPPTQQYIAIDPTTGINYKVDMALTAGDLAGSDPLAAIMNETIFQDTSGAIVPGNLLTTKFFPNSTTIRFWRCCYEIQQEGVLSASSLVLQMKCSTAVEHKNAICWISKDDFRLARSPKDPGAIVFDIIP